MFVLFCRILYYIAVFMKIFFVFLLLILCSLFISTYYFTYAQSRIVIVILISLFLVAYFLVNLTLFVGEQKLKPNLYDQTK